jgi:hypothetical protein
MRRIGALFVRLEVRWGYMMIFAPDEAECLWTMEIFDGKSGGGRWRDKKSKPTRLAWALNN